MLKGEKWAYSTLKVGKNKPIDYSAKTRDFARICEKIKENKAAYDVFGLLSEYSHGTSFYRKLQSSIGVDNMMFIFINMYWSLYRMVTIYCLGNANEDFNVVAEKLESIFYRYIQYQESLRNDFQE